MSEALAFFLNEENVITGLEFPDAGIDYVFMLHPSEWADIQLEWPARTSMWKEGITFFAAFVPMKESGQLLILALHDSDENVVFQALFSIHQSLIDELDETGVISYSMSDLVKRKIKDELQEREDSFDEFSELTELMELLDEL
jgi:hypothetical protein